MIDIHLKTYVPDGGDRTTNRFIHEGGVIYTSAIGGRRPIKWPVGEFTWLVQSRWMTYHDVTIIFASSSHNSFSTKKCCDTWMNSHSREYYVRFMFLGAFIPLSVVVGVISSVTSWKRLFQCVVYYDAIHCRSLLLYSAAAVRFWTLVQTWTSPNLTEVQFKVRATARTERHVRSKVQASTHFTEPSRTGPNRCKSLASNWLQMRKFINNSAGKKSQNSTSVIPTVILPF
jgi:hypothetical protein